MTDRIDLDEREYRAEFLWPHESGSIEEAGYEFANAKTEAYQKEMWDELISRTLRQQAEQLEAADALAEDVEWITQEYFNGGEDEIRGFLSDFLSKYKEKVQE